MVTLGRILSQHAPVLLVDAASSRIQVGRIESESASRWEFSEEEAGVGIFRAMEKLGVDPARIGAFVYCDGPGSILGIRTVATALRTWNILLPRPVFAYCGLAVVAHAQGRADVGVIADARRNSWHHYQIGRGLRRVETAALKGELVMPEGFRHWSALPEGVKSVPYSLPQLLPLVTGETLFLETESPDAFLHEEPSYVTWTPRIHRMP